MKQLWANVAHTSGAKVYSMVTGVIILALTARLLGPEGRGQAAAITTWVSLFSTFAHLSLGQVALHRMASDPTYKCFGRLLSSLLLMAGVLTLLGWLVASVMYWYNPQGVFKGLPITALMIGFVALPFMLWEQYGSSLLMGLDRIRTYNRYQVVGRTLSVVGVIVLVGLLGQGVAGVLQASIVGQIVVALGGLGFLFKFAQTKNSICQPNKSESVALLKGGAKLHLNAIGSFLFTSGSILILNYYHGAEQTAYYQMAIHLLGVLMIIPTAASMVIYGKVTRHGPNGAWPENKRLLIQITLGMICLSAVAAALAPWGITILAGEKFLPVVDPFKWMLLGVIGMTFSTVMAPQWIGRGYFWQAAILTILIGLISLIANLIFIPKYAMQGAVWVFVGTYIFSIIGNGIMVIHCQIKSKRA
jgi:O-antigen/teichoic acid export membrane protein